MSYTLFAKWFGIISTLLALGVLFNLDDAKKMAKNMIHEESGYIMGGVLPIIFGSLSFMHHNIFTLNRQLVVTLIGLAVLLVGSFRVLFVAHWRKIMQKHLDQVPALFSLFGLMFGLLLLYVGFIAPMIR